MAEFLSRAVAAATAGILLAGPVSAQGTGSGSSASSPFSGLFSAADPVANSPVDLQFRVSNGDSGLEKRLKSDSRITMALTEGRHTAQDVLAAARADYSRLLGLLYDEGYYDSVIEIRLDGVEAAGIAPLDAPQVVRQVIVTVDPGHAFRYSRADIAPLAPRTELPKHYHVGETARTSDMRNAARRGVEGWREHGHAKARIAATDIVADHQARQVDSRIVLVPGPMVRFGQLHATGNQRLSTRRLYKIAGFPEGQRFTPDKIETARRRLRRSGVFSAITLEEAETLGPGDTLDVNLTVVEQKLRRAGAGFEISSTDGAMVSGYWMHRNLLGGGERLRVDTELKDIGSGTSGRDFKAGVRIDRPATLNPDITASIEARGERLREEDYDLDLGVLGFGLTWLPSERLTGETRLEYRRSRVRDDSGTTNFEILALPTTLTWDRRDVPTDAKRGYWLSWTATPFTGLDDTGSGLRLITEGRAYRSFGEDRRFTLAARARAGSIWGPGIERTPRDYLFWSGGGGSVRGQPFESLGVRAIPGGPEGTIRTGGMSVANLTGEVRVQVRPKIGVVAFADAGRVWTDSGFGGDTDWHAGAGVGLRYDTPIGPLRLDVAGPVGGDTGEGMQLYLGLGQAF